MSSIFGKQIGNSPGAGSLLNLINSLPPMPAGPTTEFAGKNTIAAVGRIVLGQTTDRGTNGSYVRIRASAGGAILATATVGEGATSLTVINRAADAETFAIEIEAWLELVVTAATVSMLGSATIGDIGATNVNNVFARFAIPTSAAEAVTQRAYVFETDEIELDFYEATPQTVYGAGTASCNGTVTFYDVQSSLPAFVYAGSVDPADTGIIGGGGEWIIRSGADAMYTITSDAASPSLATGTWTVGTGTAPAPTVLGVTYDVEVASRVQWPIQSAVLLADFPKTNDTLTAVTGWSNDIVLEAGGIYSVTGQCPFSTGDGGAKVDFGGGTCTATGLSGTILGYADGSLLSTIGFGTNVFTSLTTLLELTAAAAIGGASFVFDITIQVDAGGTFGLRFAQDVIDVSASDLLKYSTMQAYRIA